MGKNKKRAINKLEQLSLGFTAWMGTPWSLILHTIVFAAFFVLIAAGADPNKVMLILTTAVSLEAIYLSLFIQMTVNRNTESLEEVEEDIDEIQEDVLEEDMEEKLREQQLAEMLENIQSQLNGLSKHIELVKTDLQNIKNLPK